MALVGKKAPSFKAAAVINGEEIVEGPEADPNQPVEHEECKFS